jgi:hypothetical protein
MLGISGNDTVITGPEIDSMSEEQLQGVSLIKLRGVGGAWFCAHSRFTTVRVGTQQAHFGTQQAHLGTQQGFVHTSGSGLCDWARGASLAMALRPPPVAADHVLQVVNGCNIFARASPENKLRIVRALQTGPGYEGPMDGDDPDDDGPSPRTSEWDTGRGGWRQHPQHQGPA